MRLFIGIAVPPPAQAALARATEPLRTALDARWTPGELYHLTLAFLGQRAETALPGLCELLAGTAAGREGFSLSTAGLAVFSGANVLYAAVEPCEALALLAADLRTRLTGAGEAFDPKPFAPHITLARKARPPQPFAFPDVPAVSFRAEAVTLYHSTRIDDRLRYLPLFEAPLKGGS